MGNKLVAAGFIILLMFSALLAASMNMEFPGVKVLDIQEDQSSEAYSPISNPYEYSISRPLYIYTNGIPSEDSSLYRWIEYIYSDEGQQRVTGAGFYEVEEEIKEQMLVKLHGVSESDMEDKKTITQSGSTTLGDLAMLWANDFEATEGIDVILTTPGSGTGITNLINGFVDVAQSSREIKESELERAEQSSVEIVEWIVAYDALAIIIHRDNPVDTITMEDLKNIYCGEYTNWSELGGDDASIILYGRDSASGSYDYFKEAVLDGEDYSTKMQQFSSNALIVAEVESNPGGIGYVGVGYAEEALAEESAVD